jgi:UDP-glucose 4-epimerase
MRKAIVTGGAGFIGSHMVDFLLKKKYSVIIIDNLSGGHVKNLKHLKKKIKFLKKDIRKINIKDKIFKNTKYIFHFAGIGDIVPSIERPKEYMDVNIMGTVNMLELARFHKIKKFVYAASSSCYGLAKTPTNEKHAIDPKYPYALSKYQGEQAVFHWSKLYKLKADSVCIFNAYGPRVRTTGAYGAVFGVFFKQMLENKPLTVVGDGSQKRDFVFVTDVANAFYHVAKANTAGNRYNIGAGNPIKILKLVKILKSKFELIPKRPGEPNVTFADIKKIKKVTNWRPTISFENGVKEMLKNINNWKDAPLWNKKTINEATKMWFKYLK